MIVSNRLLIAEVRRACQVYYRVPRHEILMDRRARKYAWPRQMAMTLAREVAGRSWPEVAYYLGGKDHTTAIHAVRAVHERNQADPRHKLDYEHLKLTLQVYAFQKACREVWGMAQPATEKTVDPEIPGYSGLESRKTVSPKFSGYSGDGSLGHFPGQLAGDLVQGVSPALA